MIIQYTVRLAMTPMVSSLRAKSGLVIAREAKQSGTNNGLQDSDGFLSFTMTPVVSSLRAKSGFVIVREAKQSGTNTGCRMQMASFHSQCRQWFRHIFQPASATFLIATSTGCQPWPLL
jgi:tRNA splicing ligase